MRRYLNLRLSLMMFLQFFIWGAWAVTLGSYLGITLGFDGAQIGLIYGTAAIAAIFSPLIVGFIADRFFPTQQIYAILHILGAGSLMAASHATEFKTIYIIMLLYGICYMPTLALANSLCFHNIDDPDKKFPAIRVLGTVGWIVAGLLVGFWQMEQEKTPLQVAALASIILGLYALTLPGSRKLSPDKEAQAETINWRDAFKLVVQRPFIIVFISSILICIPLAFYYNFTNLFLNEIGMTNAAGKMSIGQMSETVFLLLMPLMFKHLGIKWMMLLGMLAWVLRYLLFAYGDVSDQTIWMLYLGIALHGICYDFFFVGGQIYADRVFPSHLKSSVQGLMTVATYGVGMFIGSLVSGLVVKHYTLDGVKDWQTIWWAPSMMALVVMIGFYRFFKEQRHEKPQKS